MCLACLLAVCALGCPPPPPPPPIDADADIGIDSPIETPDVDTGIDSSLADSDAAEVADVPEVSDAIDAGDSAEVIDAGDTADVSDGVPEADAADGEVGDVGDVGDVIGDTETGVLCGDGIRDVTLEECDDGLSLSDAGDGGTSRRSCSTTCRVLDLLAVAGTVPDTGLAPPQRYLGTGRHPLATGDSGSAVAFVEPDAKPARVALTTITAKGVASDTVVPFSGGSTPVLAANPVLAPLAGGKYAAAWNDFAGDGDELGVAIRIVDPSAGSSAPPAHANVTTSFSQFDPDILWDGSQLVVAWVDASSTATSADIKYRTFSSALVATSGELTLASTTDTETDVALASFGTGWAAAWRAARGGNEWIQAKSGTTSWGLGPFLPGPSGARPALAELDATHMLLVFVRGVDPGDAGIPSAFELRGAILDTASPGAVTSFAIGSGSLSMQDPNAIRAGSRVFVTWRTDGVTGDASGEELWLKEVVWSGGALELTKSEIPMPRQGEHRTNDQRRGAFAAPSGALLMAWEDFGRGFGSIEANRDVVLELVPLPLLRLGVLDGGP